MPPLNGRYGIISPEVIRSNLLNPYSMSFTRTIAALCLCFCIPASYAQEAPVNRGIFSFGVSMSDYNFQNHSKYATAPKPSFGVQLTYWKPLVPHLDFSGNLGVALSDLPAGFVKGDSTGQRGLTMHSDALIHLKAFPRDAGINPFITAGVGWGSFGYQQAFYAPVGAGITFRFGSGSLIILQGQIREALAHNLTGTFMFYSASFAHDIPGTRAKKHKSDKEEVVKDALASSGKKNNRHVTDTSAMNATGKDIANVTDKDTASATVKVATKPLPDFDGDGIPDKDDKCPRVKGSRENDGCPFPPLEGADLVAMSPDSVSYTIYFDYDRSDFIGQDFNVLNRIVKMLQSDKTLTLHISGYADTQGTQARNMKISAERANVTLDYFLSYHIPSARITMFYYGSDQAVDETYQWRNRRVEVTIIKH
jgi:OmpA-OmpF porin, OOP family